MPGAQSLFSSVQFQISVPSSLRGTSAPPETQDAPDQAATECKRSLSARSIPVIGGTWHEPLASGCGFGLRQVPRGVGDRAAARRQETRWRIASARAFKERAGAGRSGVALNPARLRMDSSRSPCSCRIRVGKAAQARSKMQNAPQAGRFRRIPARCARKKLGRISPLCGGATPGQHRPRPDRPGPAMSARGSGSRSRRSRCPSRGCR